MRKDLQAVLQDAADLSDDDRATLAGLLIESLEGESDPDVEAAWEADLERRIGQLNAGSVDTVPWEDVRQQLLRRLNAR